jgi:hypothetical protein
LRAGLDTIEAKTMTTHIISLGAGVQSSTMALMAAAGEITPMPDCAIFADTQAEPKSVYVWLDWLEKQLPFPVVRVTKGNLSEMALVVRTSKLSGQTYTKHNIPAFTINPARKIGLMKRHCTGDFKIEMIHRKLRQLYQVQIKDFIKCRSRTLSSATRRLPVQNERT